MCVCDQLIGGKTSSASSFRLPSVFLLPTHAPFRRAPSLFTPSVLRLSSVLAGLTGTSQLSPSFPTSSSSSGSGGGGVQQGLLLGPR